MADTVLGSAVPQLQAGLAAFSGWMNGFSGRLYEMFTFPGLQEKVQQTGQQLAAALNNMVGSIDWNLLGAGLNLAVLGMADFLYTFDWTGFGMGLAAADQRRGFCGRLERRWAAALVGLQARA